MNTSPAAVQNRCTASDFLSRSSGSSRAIPLIVSVMATPSNAIQRGAPAYPERRAFYRDVLAAQRRAEINRLPNACEGEQAALVEVIYKLTDKKKQHSKRNAELTRCLPEFASPHILLIHLVG